MERDRGGLDRRCLPARVSELTFPARGTVARFAAPRSRSAVIGATRGLDARADRPRGEDRFGAVVIADLLPCNRRVVGLWRRVTRLNARLPAGSSHKSVTTA